MEMDGSGGIPLPQLPPPAKDADEAAAAAAAALSKRARKRSRYLSPPYTDTDVQEEGGAAGKEEKELRDVSAAAALSALLDAAPCYEQGMGWAALHFLNLHNRNRATAVAGSSSDGGSEKPPSPGGGGGGGGGGHTKLNLSACPAMPGPVDGSPAPALAKKKNPNKDGPMQDAAAPGQAQAARFAVNGTYAAANRAPPPERKKRKKYKKWAKSDGPPPPPLPKLPLTDIRSNLVMMIASLTATAEAVANSPDNLVREMQGLLAKVDRILQGRSATAAHHH